MDERQGHAAGEGAGSGMHRVVARLRGLGAVLALLVAEEPARLGEFLEEAARLDQAYKRWEYVRGVKEEPGAGANVVGALPPDSRYTGFEGYWAGSGRSEEEVVEHEAQLGVEVLRAIARMAGAEHSFDAGLNVLDNPRVRALHATALGQHDDLDSLRRLDPIFGGLLARLRAVADERTHAIERAAFEQDIAAAVQLVGASVYLDAALGKPLAELLHEGGVVVGEDIEERYAVPRALVTNHRATEVRLRGREREGYRLMEEIGRLGHPVVRALLHIEGWHPAERRPGDASGSPSGPRVHLSDEAP